MDELSLLAEQFSTSGPIEQITPLGHGLINDTFLVTDAHGQWVLQRINRQVFPQPEWIMQNLQRLAAHVYSKPAGICRLQIPRVLPSTQHLPYFVDAQQDYWRALEFVPASYSKETLESTTDAEQIGWALGHFHHLCSDLDCATLHDTLPGFHITPGYLAQYQQACVQGFKLPQDDAFAFCRDFIQEQAPFAAILQTAQEQGKLRLRVTHGDPKVNNFLFQQHTHQVISLIDLDTVKPGLIHYDLGDCLRSCCHNLDTGAFDLDLCQAILTPYIAECRGSLTAADYDYLYPAIELLPFELGLRFFTDYLQGNRYFKVTAPQQNLSRALEQFQLCQAIQRQRQSIEDLISALRY